MASRLTGTYNYASQPGGYPYSRFTMQPDPLYALPAGKQPNVNAIVGTPTAWRAVALAGTRSTSTLRRTAPSPGPSNECPNCGQAAWRPGNQSQPVPRGGLRFLEQPHDARQLHRLRTVLWLVSVRSASALFDNLGNVIGLRIRAGLSQGGQRSHTVFVGSKR